VVRDAASLAEGASPTGWKPVPQGRLPRGTAFPAVRASPDRARAPKHGHPGRESKSAASLKNELDGKINCDLNQCEQDLVEFKKLVDGKSAR
jgi:hypothetical protein